MQVIVKGRHTEVPESLKNLAVRKVERVQRFYRRIQSLEIEFSEEHSARTARRHHVEVTMWVKGHVLRATADGPDAPTAVDAVVDKLETQVRKLKGKVTRRGNRGGSDNGGVPRAQSVPSDALEFREVLQAAPSRAEANSGRSRITRTTRIAVKPMTPEEAVLQCETLGQDFFLFVNAETQQAGVVYRRNDGYGLVEPE